MDVLEGDGSKWAESKREAREQEWAIRIDVLAHGSEPHQGICDPSGLGLLFVHHGMVTTLPEIEKFPFGPRRCMSNAF